MKSLLFLLAIAATLFFGACSGSGSRTVVTASVEPVVTPFSASVDENSPAGTMVGELSVDDGGSSVTAIVLSGVDAGDFTVEVNGTITVSGSLDFETKPLYQLSAVATNSVGDSTPVDVNITVNDLAEPVVPVLTAFSANVDENSSAGTVVGQLAVNDGGSAVTAIALSGLNATDFSADTNGTITVAGVIDFEVTPLYELTAVATNGVGESGAVDVNITVNNLAEAVVPVLTAFSGNIDENSAEGTFIGALTVDDGGSVITAITLSGSGEGNFTVETNGSITVAAGALLDYEMHPSYTLQAVATNGIGDSAPVDLNISLNNLFDVMLTTGQTSSYTPFDDGDYQKGSDRNYTRDDINETVFDNTTGLMWQDNATVQNDTYDWAAAQTECESLSLDGYTDWRLPAFEELLSITDMQESYPAMNAVFMNVAQNNYWSSTTYAFSTGSAWAISFDFGSDSAVSKGNFIYIRCVR